MTNLILTLIVCSTVITTVINFSKPAYEGLVKKKYVATISIALALILGLIASFSLDFDIANSIWTKILLWLWLWTWSTIWYDFWEIIKSFEKKVNNED